MERARRRHADGLAAAVCLGALCIADWFVQQVNSGTMLLALPVAALPPGDVEPRQTGLRDGRQLRQERAC